MTWYLSIRAMQPVHDLGLDDAGRQVFGFNIECAKRPSHTFADELVTRLEAQGVGTFGTDIFSDSSAVLPTDEDTTFLHIGETFGGGADYTQDRTTGPAYEHPHAQIVARSKTSEDARTLAAAAYDALVGVRNVDLPSS